MKLLGKKKKDKDSSQNEESAPLEDNLSSGDNKEASGNEPFDSAQDREEDLLSQYASADQALQEDEPEQKDALDGISGDNKDDDDVSSELMDIFTSEDVEGGTDLGALADILEDIDIHSLVEEAKNVEARLRNLVQATQ